MKQVPDGRVRPESDDLKAARAHLRTFTYLLEREQERQGCDHYNEELVEELHYDVDFWRDKVAELEKAEKR